MSKILGYHSPLRAKNFLINGDMSIAQRNTTFSSIASGYFLDRYQYIKSGTMVHTASQDTDVPSLAQAGVLFTNSLRLNLTTPDTSISATDFCVFAQPVEGYNFAKLAQKPMTLSFWVKASLAGIYCVSLKNTASDRAFVSEYTINTANTWEFKVIQVTASPSSGTWNYTNGSGLSVIWTIAAGSNFQTTANSWTNGNFLCTSNQVNGVNTGATDFRVTGAMLCEGNMAPKFQLFGETIEGEIEACQRYYQKSYDLTVNPGTTSFLGAVNYTSRTGDGYFQESWEFRTRMRATPTVSILSALTGGSGVHVNGGSTQAATAQNINQTSAQCQNNAISPAGGTVGWHWVCDAEI